MDQGAVKVPVRPQHGQDPAGKAEEARQLLSQGRRIQHAWRGKKKKSSPSERKKCKTQNTWHEIGKYMFTLRHISLPAPTQLPSGLLRGNCQWQRVRFLTGLAGFEQQYQH